MSLWGLYVFLGLLAVAMITGMWYVGRRAKKRERELMSSRSADTPDSFVTSFRPELQPIARAMYAEFQPYTFSKNVPFQKSDRVAEILGFEKIDLDEPLKKVADQFGCRKPSKEDNNRFRARETFEDYVEFIHFLRSSDAGGQQTSVLQTH